MCLKWVVFGRYILPNKEGYTFNNLIFGPINNEEKIMGGGAEEYV